MTAACGVRMTYETILVERKDAVAKIILNRPERMNSMTPGMKDDIVAALGELEADDTVRVVVFTGAGDKTFASGADIAELVDWEALEVWKEASGGFLFDPVANFPKPTIAMINGYALGGGCELAMACDIRIASDRAKLNLAEVVMGVIPGGGGSQRLPRLVGEGNAMKMILTADMIGANEAYRIGLVDEVVPHEELEQRTLELAAKISTKSPLLVRLAKQAVKAASEMPLRQGLRYEASLFGLAFTTEDRSEGMRAFLEKRPPQWRGR